MSKIQTLPIIIVLCFLILSCTKEDDYNLYELTEYDINVINYFKEVALGFEYGEASEITRRWETDLKIFVGGEYNQEIKGELDLLINEINDLTTTKFEIETVTDSLQSNFYIYFGTADSFKKIYPSQSNLILFNSGMFTVFWNQSNQIEKGNIFVNNVGTTLDEQFHVLREELTQSLGLGRDSNSYPKSIFYNFNTKTNYYLQIDRDLVRLLYHPDMKTNLNTNNVENVLKQILINEKKDNIP